MAQFSERIGAVQPITALQIKDVGDELRSSLWNVLYRLYQNEHGDYWKRVAAGVAENFRKTPIDDLPYHDYECRNWLKEYFYSLTWFKTYDFVEFIVNHHSKMAAIPSGERIFFHPTKKEQLIEWFNAVLERELSAYRFIAGVLSPIANSVEGEAISATIHA